MGNQRSWSCLKNLPSKLYWILFPINNLREAVDTAKKVLNKEKLEKQLMGQASNTFLFMKLRDTMHSGQKVSINKTTRSRIYDFNDVQYVSTAR